MFSTVGLWENIPGNGSFLNALDKLHRGYYDIKEDEMMLRIQACRHHYRERSERECLSRYNGF